MKNKNLIIIFGIIGAIILVLLLFLVPTQQSLISIPQAGEQTKSFTFDGISGVAKSTYWGSIKSSGNLDFQNVKEGFCGDNDGKITVSNSLSGGSSLSLSSSMSNTGSLCGGNGNNFGSNYIEIKEITIPAGKLTGTCKVSARESSYDASARASCNIKYGGSSIGTSAYHQKDCDLPDRNPNWLESNCKPSDEKDFELSFEEETTIEIMLTSSAVYKGSSSAQLSLDFEPKPQKQTFYRLENNQCSEISILPSEKTENDYSTLQECQNKIVSNTTKYLPIIIIGSIIITFIIVISLILARRK